MSTTYLDKLVKDLRVRVGEMRGKRKTTTVAIFDLVGSTPMKLREGHTLGKEVVLLHNLICRKIATKYNGTIIKELGDGVLIVFGDPVSACRAAVDIKTATHKTKNILTKASLTHGVVEEIRTGRRRDVLGNTVDRCARIQSLALPDQILIDDSLYRTASSFLMDYPNIIMSSPKKVKLRGIGHIIVHELSSKETGFAPCNIVPLTAYENGRLSIEEKVSFMGNAKREVIELGTGLTTFAEYFTNRRPAEFKDHVVRLMKQGVTFKCMLLNPDSKVAHEYAKDIKEKNLIKNIRHSIEELKKQRKEFTYLNLRGSIKIYLYSRFPYFHAVCVDPETETGQITVSHYLHGLSRAEAPVFQFCNVLNKEMFAKYWLSIKELLKESKTI